MKELRTQKSKVKHLGVALVVMLTSVFGFSQSAFQKFEDMNAVTSVVVNQKMFKMLADLQINTDDPESQELMEMVKKISSLKVLTTGDSKVAADMNSTVAKYLKSDKLEELMRVKDGEQTINFYVREGKDDNHVKELLMFINGLKEMTSSADVTINGKKREVETVLLSLTGDIDLRQISKLTNKMNLPGGEQLKKVDKAKKQ